jgi:uncharacterized protein
LKYLLWALLIYLAWRWFSAAQARKSAQAGDAAVSEEPTSSAGAERMVKCAECGLHLPLSEALPGSGDRFFCSDAHRLNAPSS